MFARSSVLSTGSDCGLLSPCPAAAEHTPSSIGRTTAASDAASSPDAATLTVPMDVVPSRTFDLRFLAQARTGAAGVPSEQDGSLLHLILLNRPLPSCTFAFMRRAASVVCADGGSNRLYELTQQAQKQQQDSGASAASDTSPLLDGYASLLQAKGHAAPTHICGDLDSMREQVATHYRAFGTEIIRNPCQETNDLEKCFKLVQTLHSDSSSSKENTNSSSKEHSGASGRRASGGAGETPGRLLVLGAFGGRFDQVVCNMHLLYKWQSGNLPQSKVTTIPPMPTAAGAAPTAAPPPSIGEIYMLGDGSFVFLLPPGRNKIIVPLQQGGGAGLSDVCGLLPLGAPASKVRTSGLRWNLDGEPLELSERISSSNRVEPQGDTETAEVSVETDAPLLWFSELLGCPE